MGDQVMPNQSMSKTAWSDSLHFKKNCIVLSKVSSMSNYFKIVAITLSNKHMDKLVTVGKHYYPSFS